ncbi:MAG TPA: tRNA (N6-isopentenyl adenosine(37)-C2)-methylthiotransferase MiaB [Polyangiales bacterium]|nr:tRNA (N6-isopentenyl adenosine(37)-C2)-methylthiotransferase MiaB [Polyangiales bacterium]
MRRFLIQTFGCQMNAHDSRRIAEVLGHEGYEQTDEAELADLIVLNTCSVREKAEHKLVSTLGTFRQLKQRRRGVLIAVAGCMAQEHGADLLERQDLIDVLIGPDNVPELPALLARAHGGERVALAEHDLLQPRFLTAEPHADGREVFAYVTTMKGCDERCSFCIVPYTRGAERYRSADEIVGEIRGLVSGGVREITLLGQTVNSWHDPSDAQPEPQSRFAWLLREIARDVPDLLRLRYTSPHPRHVTPELIAAHAELEVLPAHVHLPVQSGSDAVLKRMIRRYTRASYLERVRALQAGRPGLTLSTDIIVGFPGESEADFQQTLSLVEEAGFVAAFGFKYSPRPQTPALKLGDDVPEEVKSERLERLFAVVDRLQLRHLESLVGTRARVLIEGPSKSQGGGTATRFTGRSDRHEIVHVEIEAGQDPTGALLEVEIVEANKRSLLGRVLPGQSLRRPSIARGALRLPVMAS